MTLAPFLVGVLALAALALRAPQVWRLRGIDALGVSVLAAVAALCITATLFSSFQRLTGTTWSAGLAVMAAGLLLVKSSGDVEAQPPGFTAGQWLLLLIPAVFVGYEQFVSPVARFDDLIHYAARAGYWLTINPYSRWSRTTSGTPCFRMPATFYLPSACSRPGMS